ncbi:MAG TPA: hypothetical protein VD905_06755 [Flavobacteriales bacterium]|nr:hypothetical protein [Flavobacteriales bacterium]
MFASIQDYIKQIPALFGNYWFSDYKLKYTGNFLKDAGAYMARKEGGKSNNPADDAAANSSPWEWTNPKTKVTAPLHTNKGVTWLAFKKYAPEFGYKVDKDTFFNMPDELVSQIFIKRYAAQYADLTSSKLINIYAGFWNWGGSAEATINKFKKITGKTLQEYLHAHGEAATLKEMVRARIKLFEALAAEDPGDREFLKGWINGALNFYYYFLPYAKN